MSDEMATVSKAELARMEATNAQLQRWVVERDARIAELEDANRSPQNGYDLAISKQANLQAIVNNLPDWIAYLNDSRNAGIVVKQMKDVLAQLKETP